MRCLRGMPATAFGTVARYFLAAGCTSTSAMAARGRSYGWHIFEGNDCFTTQPECYGLAVSFSGSPNTVSDLAWQVRNPK